MSRQKSSVNNLIWGIIGNVITTLIAIIIPRLFIVNYGSEINGFLSSIKQIYVYLALLEAGIGDASVVALYGPIAKGQIDDCNKILAATHYYYKRIGVLYGLLIIALGLIYPLFLDTTLPYLTCFLIIVLQGSGNVISYMFQGKYNMLLRVDNRNYVTTNLGTVTSTATDIIRIILLLNGRSIIAVQSIYLIFNVVKMLYISYYIKKHYKWINLKVKPNFTAVSRNKSVFTHQISSLIFSQTDVLILTFVCGLKTVSLYSIYATVFGMIDNIVTIVSNSVQSALGQIYNSDKNKYLKLQEAFEVYYLALVFALFDVTLVLILPFVSLYTAGADMNYVNLKLAILFCVCRLLNYGRVSSGQIIGFEGAYKDTQWRAILESVINLVVSFICVFTLGIYGVLIGTAVALLYRANDMIIYANHKLLHRSAKPTYRRWLTNIIVFIITVFAFYKLKTNINSYLTFFINAIWITPASFIIFVGVNTIIEKDARKTAAEYIVPALKSIRNKLKIR